MSAIFNGHSLVILELLVCQVKPVRLRFIEALKRFRFLENTQSGPRMAVLSLWSIEA